MARRLSDLLERIRPAGAPGAATEATPRRDLEAAEEIAAVVAALALVDKEAEQTIAAARAEAARIRADAERRAREIAADLPDRVAAAGAAGGPAVEPAQEERDRVEAAAAEQVEQLRAAAPRVAERAVERAMAAIWAMLPPAGGGA